MPVVLPAVESREPRPRAPNPFVWLGLLLVLMVAGAVITLVTWPKAEPTGTVEFWLCLLGRPALTWGVLFGLRLGYFDQESERIDAQNEVLREDRDRALQFAGEPLAAIACAYLTAAGDKALAAKVLQRASVLEARIALDGREGVRHSALDLLLDKANPSRYHVCFRRLIAAMQKPVGALPLEVPFGVRLQLPADVDRERLRQAWQDCWDEQSMRRCEAKLVPGEQGLMALDEWLDHRGGPALEKVLLFVAVQLHDAPPQNSAEVATAVLVGWPQMLSRRGMAQLGLLHRPVRGHRDELNMCVSTALQWGRATNIEIGDLWQAGLEKDDKGAVNQTLSDLKLGVSSGNDLSGVHDVDLALGEPGCASGWLALALSLEHAKKTNKPQLVAWREGALHFAVVQPTVRPPQPEVSAVKEVNA
ncbi:hypothetical protein [Caballeronia glebae]|uniref:Uncharacterized protein n=1 Tax=Caballeronia glebae TaxID=1777143 RepID=A0A158DVB0_9BURK|nr:hypothetical protein [Caballeronia glebae]SAK98126.1 hypothetical protein AWB82_07187 [Caballeronia glebae]